MEKHSTKFHSISIYTIEKTKDGRSSNVGLELLRKFSNISNDLQGPFSRLTEVFSSRHLRIFLEVKNFNASTLNFKMQICKRPIQFKLECSTGWRLKLYLWLKSQQSSGHVKGLVCQGPSHMKAKLAKSQVKRKLKWNLKWNQDPNLKKSRPKLSLQGDASRSPSWQPLNWKIRGSFRAWTYFIYKIIKLQYLHWIPTVRISLFIISKQRVCLILNMLSSYIHQHAWVFWMIVLWTFIRIHDCYPLQFLNVICFADSGWRFTSLYLLPCSFEILALSMFLKIFVKAAIFYYLSLLYFLSQERICFYYHPVSEALHVKLNRKQIKFFFIWIFMFLELEVQVLVSRTPFAPPFLHQQLEEDLVECIIGSSISARISLSLLLVLNNITSCCLCFLWSSYPY